MNCVKGTSYEMCCINDRFATCNGPIELCEQFFGVLLTVHLSIFILVINQLDVQNFCFTKVLFHASTCFEHHVPIIRTSKLYYTATGIITPIAHGVRNM